MPAAKTAPTTPDNGTAAPSMVDAASAFVGVLITQAEDLELDRVELLDKISKNRDELRNLDELGALSAEQGDWLEMYYPAKERGDRRSDEDIKATRELKVAAAKRAKSRRDS